MADSGPEIFIAIVALIIAVIALTANCLQVVQQLLASAKGYSQCNEHVMGPWSKTRKRRVRWEEFRFEVHYETPVIFVSPPTNKQGPVPNAEPCFLDGTSRSLRDTWTMTVAELKIKDVQKSEKQRIHTIDNGRASWFNLICAVQQMESESRDWQQKQYHVVELYHHSHLSHLSRQPPSLNEHHTLTVALQRRRRTWDTMPTHITKPYATTTICHLVEMMAALGVFWKEFDRKNDKYRAEGNGYMVYGERVVDLGLMFNFRMHGQHQFEQNRVIPVDEIKELCFGYVPTVYRVKLDQRRLQRPSDDLMELSTFVVGSCQELCETLNRIGCNRTTVQYFLEDGKRTSHLYPMSFEIVAMLGRTLHIKGSSFIYIPNPTPDRWDKSSFSLIKMMEAYGVLVVEELPGVKRNQAVTELIRSHIGRIMSHQNEREPGQRLLLIDALHQALESLDQVLKVEEKDLSPTAAASLTKTTTHFHEPVSDIILTTEPITHYTRQDLIRDVLRIHIQEVMKLLNDGTESSATIQSSSLSEDLSSSAESSTQGAASSSPTIAEALDQASPDVRQHLLMKAYFRVIRHRVASQAKERPSIKILSSAAASPSWQSNPKVSAESIAARSVSVSTENQSAPAIKAGHNGIPLVNMDATKGALRAEGQKSQEGLLADSSSLADQPISSDDVWCVLVFRMICWLMLHDFDKQDVQVHKSELLGSRVPVYIS